MAISTDLIYRYYSNDQIEANLSEEFLGQVQAQVEAIQAYANEQFPGLSLLSDEEAVILSMSIFVPHQSPEKGIVATDRNYMEVKRALSRLYCTSLLRQGENGYERFVAPQPKNSKFLPVLEKEQYLQLAEKYQNIDILKLDTLKVATLISSVPLSKEARKRADIIFGKDQYIVDTVEFAAKVFEDINVARQIYPQVDYLFQKYPEPNHRERIVEYLHAAFPHERHYRHMLYTEALNNKKVFEKLIAAIRTGQLSKDAYDFWVLYWNTNITGFQGNVEPKGSVYLTSNTFRCMNALESVLESIFDDPSTTAKDIMQSYLDQRASFLQLNDPKNTVVKLNIAEQRFLAHKASMLRIVHPDLGQVLAAAYQVIKKVISPLLQNFFNSEESMPTPTYAPALYGNVRDCLKKRYDEESIFKSAQRIKAKGINHTADELKEMLALFENVVISVPIYLAALQQYKAMRNDGIIAANIPLSFQSIADPKWVTQLFNKSILFDNINILELVDITVSDKGIISYVQKPDYEERLQAQLSGTYEPEIYEDPVRIKTPMLTPGFSAQLAPTASSSQPNRIESEKSIPRPGL